MINNQKQESSVEDKTRKMYENMIYENYGKHFLYNKKQVSLITERSIASIDRDIKNLTGVRFIKHGENGAIAYPIHAIIDYLTGTVKQY